MEAAKPAEEGGQEPGVADGEEGGDGSYEAKGVAAEQKEMQQTGSGKLGAKLAVLINSELATGKGAGEKARAGGQG